MFNVMVGSAIVSSIFSLLRLPACDGDWQVVNLWSIGCSASQSMLEEMLIVAFRKVSPRMGPTRLSSQKGRIGNRLGYVEHEIKLKRVHDFCVEGGAAILNDDVLESFSTSLDGRLRFFPFRHPCVGTVDRDAFVRLLPVRRLPPTPEAKRCRHRLLRRDRLEFRKPTARLESWIPTGWRR